MDILEALVSMGVNQSVLTMDQKQSLDIDGFLRIEAVLSRSQVDAINQTQRRILAAEGDLAGHEVGREAGVDRLADLINKDPIFHIVLREPRVLAGIANVLRWDLKLSSLNSRAAPPGQGLQELHADWGRLEVPGDYQVCNSIWLLDDFIPENGATRAVPGTHRSTRTPADDMPDARADHPKQRLLLGKAGDVFVFNSHTWHGGTLNRTSQPRRALHTYFCRRHQPQQTDQVKSLRSETRERLSLAERVVLGVE